MNDTTTPGAAEGHLELIHVHYTPTGLRAKHTTLMGLGRWIQQKLDKINNATAPMPGETDAVENPLGHLLNGEKAQVVRPAGRSYLINLLYGMSKNETPEGAEPDAPETIHLRQLAGELATTIRCLHQVRENDCILFVID